ncbi:Acetyl xylan esterase [Fibrella aestuarina BUZ 2]|uniref:Acetyl xylan esterase n=1 Tax=Fibrella aestuarina BUZ 2 TaxID=1166018 RepID=I0K9C9_9BACT|nr:acetylxylan esterase [Fibrella aestuarina]CCH00732.1 Acetyl xylan esterase [Fibrella aestuarina BUZ 2]
MKKTLFLLLVTVTNLLAQPVERLVKVVVTPDHADWHYKLGEAPRFNVVVYQNNVPLRGANVRYEIGPEKMDPTQKETLTLRDGTANLTGTPLKTAGFLRCTATAVVDGREYRGMATAAFDPLSIKPTVVNPTDFQAFWDKAKADLAAIPLDARMTLLPERCTGTVNVYHVNINNFVPPTQTSTQARLYGILCVPKAEGKYPALLKVPGAGIRPYAGDVAMAERGIITLEIGIHGIPVNMDPAVYANLAGGALANYPMFNLDDRDRYYYKRVYMGCVRAIDFIASLPQYDGQNLAVTGGSQGGALSIVTAGLDKRVKWLGAYYPALSDMTGYLSGRAGGWPHLFTGASLAINNTPPKVSTVGYYDVVNFARLVNVPGYYSWGYNDETCPPTSMYAAYNVINAPKLLSLFLDTGHWTYPEQTEKMNNWLVERLKGSK